MQRTSTSKAVVGLGTAVTALGAALKGSRLGAGLVGFGLAHIMLGTGIGSVPPYGTSSRSARYRDIHPVSFAAVFESAVEIDSGEALELSNAKAPAVMTHQPALNHRPSLRI